MDEQKSVTHDRPRVIEVLVVEDEPEFLHKFSEAVAGDARLRLLDAVASGREARSVLACRQPDVMLVDLGLPDMSGLEVMREGLRRHPSLDILVVTMFGDDEHVLRSIEAGATGYLLKDASASAIRAAIHELHAGGSPISPSIARRVLSRFRPPASAAPATSGALSEREVETLRLIARGLSVKETGLALGISPHTVNAHLKNIYQKLAVNSRSGAVYEALQMGWL